MLRCSIRLLLLTVLFAALLAPVPAHPASDSSWHVLAPVRTPPVLYQPSGIAVDSAGRLVVTDAAAGDVRQLSPSARPLAVWDLNRSGQHILAGPSGVARGKNGDFYVADPGNRQVVELAPNGTLVRSWLVPGLASSTASTPIGPGGKTMLTLSAELAIATGPSGNVLTLQPSGKTQFILRRYSPAGVLLGGKTVSLHVKVDTSFPESSGLEYIVTPLGIAVTASGTQFVAVEDQVCSISRDNRCRAYQVLQKRSASGAWRGEWTVTESEVGPRQPTGLAVDRAGHLLVPSPQDNRIYTYSVAGVPLRTWKPPTNGVGDFSDIGGIAVNASGAVFLVGVGDRTVQKLSPSGSRLAIWGSRQSDVFNDPHQITVDGAGNVYLADTNNNRVKKLRPDGTTAGSWNDPAGPLGVAVGPSGDIYVSDERGGVREFSSGGMQRRMWSSTGRGPGQLRGPGGIAVDAAGNVYVADTFNQRIQKFSAHGSFLMQWGSRGTGRGQFENPGDVTVSPAGTVYVADTGNGRIEAFSPAGTFLAAYHVPTAPWDGDFPADYPPSVAVNAAGDIFTSYGYDAVVEIVPGGTPRFFGGRGLAPGQFQSVYGVALDRAGALYVSDLSPVDIRRDRIQKVAAP